MNQKNNNWFYVKIGFTMFLTLVATILFFFIVFRFQGFSDIMNTLFGILRPFVFGAVIAYLLRPICRSFERLFHMFIHGKWEKLIPGLGVVCSILFGFACVTALVLMVLPNMLKSIIALTETLPEEYDALVANIEHIVNNNDVLVNYLNVTSDTLETTVTDWLDDTIIPQIGNVVSGVSQSVISAALVLKDLLIGVVASIYFLGGRHTFRRQIGTVLRAIFPKKAYEVVREELIYTDKMFGGFISGKIVDSMIIGVLCAIFCLIVRMPNTLLVSVIVGVTNVIPFFGPYFGAIPCILLILIESPVKAVVFTVFIIILQQADGNIIGPSILGNTTGLSSFWVLFSILLFGGIFGFVGMIIGVPTFAVIYDIAKKLIEIGLKKHEEGAAT